MKRLLDVLDIFVFALAVAAFIGIIATGAGTGRAVAREAIAKAERAEKALRDALEVDDYEKSDGSKLLDSALDLDKSVRDAWNSTTPSREVDVHLFYHEGNLDDLRQGRTGEVRFMPPHQLSVTTELGSITITWVDNDRSTVEAAGYVVYRASGGQMTEVGRVDATEKVFVDQKVTAGTEYEYSVSTRTNDKALVAAGTTESERSTPVRIRAQKDYEIRPRSYDAAKSAMRVLVRKFVQGEWLEKEFDVAAGGEIGNVDPGSEVDYRTHCRVIEFATRSEEVSQVRDEVEFDRSGRVVVVEGQPKMKKVENRRTVQVVALKFKNELGLEEAIELRM